MSREFEWNAGPKAKVVLALTEDSEGTYSLTTSRVNGKGRRTVTQRVTGKDAGKANVLWGMHVNHWTYKYGSPSK